MVRFGPAMLALAIASLITTIELITSKYPHTAPLIGKCRYLYAYVLIYGLISFGVTLGFDQLVQSGRIKLEGVGADPWWQAVALGFSTKALLHIRIFSVTAGAQSFPIGTETIVQLFEPWLLDQVMLYEFNAVKKFIAPRAAAHLNLAQVKRDILENLPPAFSGPERTAFQADINNQTSVVDAMEMYLSRFGKASFDRVFP
jgi:hypothetical protein